MKIEGHDSLAPSVKEPKGNGGLAPSKTPKLHEPVIADMSIKSCDSLALGIAPNGHTHDGPASGKITKHHESAIVDNMMSEKQSPPPQRACDAPKQN